MKAKNNISPFLFSRGRDMLIVNSYEKGRKAMIEIQGKYNAAKVFTNTLDTESAAQIAALCDQPFAEGSRIRMMPDVHAGAGCTIGTTMTVTDKAVPNLVGVDIGCGMETVLLKEKSIELSKLDKVIRERVPAGFNARETPHRFAGEIDLTRLHCFSQIDPVRAQNSIGTLGGGNHFIEMNKDDEGNLYLVIHSGSRYFGLQVAKHYQNQGVEQCRRNGIDEKELIARLKKEGRQAEIEGEIARLKKERPMPNKDFCYVEGELFKQYLHDIDIAQNFALLNRRAMAAEIVKGMKLTVRESFATIHNYIDTENMILRKGAVSAQKGERLLIPINMRDGSLLCIGKGNPDWNYSAPHGAGRLMSRMKARESFTVSEFKKQMAGVYTTTVNAQTLDECPMAYKSMEDIVENIQDTASIIKIIRPIYNFKAAE